MPVLKVPMLKDGIRTILRKKEQDKQQNQAEKLRVAAASEAEKRETREAEKKLEELYAGITSGFEWITPNQAAQWLTDHNLRNRKLRKSTARKYAQMMANGHWLPTGDAICFDTEDNLLNGQHRLEGIVQSGTKAYLLVVRGLPSESQLVMDRALGRQAWESVNLEGMVGTNKREESVARAMMFHGSSRQSGGALEPTALRNFLITHAEAINFVLDRVQTKSIKLFPAPIVAAIARAYYAGDHARLAEFIDVYMTGMPFGAHDRAAVLLREFMLAHQQTSLRRARASGGEPLRVKQYRRAEHALRAFLGRRPIARLGTSKREELFPLPEERP